MKKNSLIVIFFIIIIILFGCSPHNSSNSGNNDNNNGNNNVSLNKVIIPLPKKVNNRGVSKSIGLIEAKNLTNHYEVIIAHKIDNTGDNYDAYYCGLASEEADAIEIDNIPIGNYDILLLAGVETGYGPLLLASSYVSDRAITDGTNTINMTLDSIDLYIESPNVVSVGTKFDVTIKIDTRNPFIKLDNGMTLSYYKNVDDNAIQLYGNYEEIGTDLYKVTYVDITAAITVATGKLKLSDNHYYAFNNYNNSRWFIAIGYHFLGSYYEKPIKFIQNGLPDVEVGISWSEE